MSTAIADEALQTRVIARLTLAAGLAECAGANPDDVMAALHTANAAVLSGAVDISTLRKIDEAWDAAMASSRLGK